MALARIPLMLRAVMPAPQTHSKVIGYLLWIFGFFGGHRFYFGRPITGTIWFFTLGLLGVGWIIDLFLIPGMERSAGRKYRRGSIDYSVAWLLQTFIGPLGIHRFYMGKIWTGLLWLFTGGLFLVGWLYDFWTLNRQVDQRNSES
jgi:TM2 domain-containing membrane protein YozV